MLRKRTPWNLRKEDRGTVEYVEYSSSSTTMIRIAMKYGDVIFDIPALIEIPILGNNAIVRYYWPKESECNQRYLKSLSIKLGKREYLWFDFRKIHGLPIS